jgi:hypothetical protein
MRRRIAERRPKAERASLALKPIEAPPLAMTSGTAVVTPSGNRIEGLTLGGVVALLCERGLTKLGGGGGEDVRRRCELEHR